MITQQQSKEAMRNHLSRNARLWQGYEHILEGLYNLSSLDPGQSAVISDIAQADINAVRHRIYTYLKLTGIQPQFKMMTDFAIGQITIRRRTTAITARITIDTNPRDTHAAAIIKQLDLSTEPCVQLEYIDNKIKELYQAGTVTVPQGVEIQKVVVGRLGLDEPEAEPEIRAKALPEPPWRRAEDDEDLFADLPMVNMQHNEDTE